MNRYQGNGASHTYIAAISLEEFSALDIADRAAVYKAIQNNIITTGKGTNDSNQKTFGNHITDVDTAKITEKAKGNNKVVLLCNGHNILWGLTDDISLIPAPVDLIPALGWNENAFTVDFLFENAKTDTTYSVSVFNAANAESAAANAEVVASGSVNGVAVKPASSNAIYSARVKGGNDSTKASVYGLVMRAIASIGEGDIIAAEQIDAINTVLNDGGLYLIADDSAEDTLKYRLTDEVKDVLTLKSSAKNTLTVTITDITSNAGLSFANAKTITTIANATAVVADDGKSVTITITSGDMEELEDIFLEEIEFVFEPDEVSKIADETGLVDFVEEI